MRCFYHQEKEAVGGCKSCGKGLCAECAADLGKGLACRGRCEEDVEALITLIDRNIQIQPTTARIVRASRTARLAGSLFNLITGAVILFFGLDSELTLLTVLGACFLAYGLFDLVWSRWLGVQANKTEK